MNSPWSKAGGYWMGMLVGLSLLLMTLPAYAASNVLTWLDNATNEQNFEVWSKIIPTPSPGVILNCAADPILYTLLATVGPNTTMLPLTTFVHANVMMEPPTAIRSEPRIQLVSQRSRTKQVAPSLYLRPLHPQTWESAVDSSTLAGLSHPVLAPLSME